MEGRKVTMTTTLETKALQIAVPLSKEENGRINRFLKKTGLKKGAFVRKAILNELERQEQQA